MFSPLCARGPRDTLGLLQAVLWLPALLTPGLVPQHFLSVAGAGFWFPRLFAGQEHVAHWNQVSSVCFYWGRPFLACLKRKSLQRQVKGCCAPQGSNLDQDSLFLALKGKVRRGIVSGHVLRAFLLPDVPRLTSGPGCRCSPPALSAQRAAAQASASPAVPPATPKHLESGCSEGSCSELGIRGYHSSPRRPPVPPRQRC